MHTKYDIFLHKSPTTEALKEIVFSCHIITTNALDNTIARKWNKYCSNF